MPRFGLLRALRGQIRPPIISHLAIFASISGLQTDSSCGAGSLLEDQPVEVISYVRQ